MATRALAFVLAAGAVSVSAAQAQIVAEAATTAFTNIATTGTALTTSDDAEINISAAALGSAGFLGNELLGVANIRVGNNGAVLWNATAGDIGYINRNDFLTMAGAGPVSGASGNGGLQAGVQMVCPLWDDNTPGTGGGIRWQVIGGNLIVQWTNQDHFNATGTGTVTYQMVVHSGVTIASGNPLVTFVYDDTLYGSPAYQNDGGSATIGFKNWNVNPNANDAEFGLGGGVNTLADPTYAAGTNMQPKVGGHTASFNGALPKAVIIRGTPTGPSCDGDVNCDFALDGFDVETQEKAVGGDTTDYCQPDPDFNGDFALDGFDVEAVEIVVGGGPCP